MIEILTRKRSDPLLGVWRGGHAIPAELRLAAGFPAEQGQFRWESRRDEHYSAGIPACRKAYSAGTKNLGGTLRVAADLSLRLGNMVFNSTGRGTNWPPGLKIDTGGFLPL